MQRRFLVIFLAGGLTLGLCGCGSSGTALPPEPVAEAEVENTSAYTTEDVLPEVWYTADDLLEMWDAGTITKEEIAEKAAAGEMNDATFEEMMSYIEKEEEYAARIEAIRASDKGWSIHDLTDLYYAGGLSKEEIAEMAATGEISSETFEEFLARIEWNGESTIQSETVSESENVESDTDMLSLLSTHVIEYEDQDGYQIRETCQLSPIFTEDDMETVFALWETLGNNADSFPNEDSLYDKNYLLRDARDSASCDKLEYIVGTYTIENLTDGFSITPDSPRIYSSRLVAKQVSTFDEEHDGTAASAFNDRYVIVVMYPDGAVYYDEEDAGNSGVMLGISKMESDIWGPSTFIIALPNGATPNRPNGYRYNEIQLQFGCLASPYSDSDTFGLAYFE